jgi:hypothetical protein
MTYQVHRIGSGLIAEIEAGSREQAARAAYRTLFKTSLRVNQELRPTEGSLCRFDLYEDGKPIKGSVNVYREGSL